MRSDENVRDATLRADWQTDWQGRQHTHHDFRLEYLRLTEAECTAAAAAAARQQQLGSARRRGARLVRLLRHCCQNVDWRTENAGVFGPMLQRLPKKAPREPPLQFSCRSPSALRFLASRCLNPQCCSFPSRKPCAHDGRPCRGFEEAQGARAARSADSVGPRDERRQSRPRSAPDCAPRGRRGRCADRCADRCASVGRLCQCIRGVADGGRH
jgi:hypothetical protein